MLLAYGAITALNGSRSEINPPEYHGGNEEDPNMREPYVTPAIVAEDEMEQTALLTCYILPEEQHGPGAFILDAECADDVAKYNSFAQIEVGCQVIYTGEWGGDKNPVWS